MPRQQSHTHKLGFTLVELSIVLVIIGLIVGGIVGGQSLIASAKLNSLVTELSTLKTTLRAYELQYDYLPGDHPDAWDYYSADPPPYCSNSSLCNGDGDGKIEYSGGGGSGNENNKAWAHLDASKIIPVTYYAGSSLGQSSSFPEACWRIINEGLYGAPAVNYFNFGVGSYCGDAVLTVAQAYRIDKKLDDGHGAKGTIRARSRSQTDPNLDCVTVGNYGSPTNTTYNLATTAVSCRMGFQYD